MTALRQADPRCDWAVLSLKAQDGGEDETPVSAVLTSHLADAHHHVRMLVATSVERYAPEGAQSFRFLTAGTFT